MQLTLFGIIWILFLFICSLLSNNKGLLFMTLFSMVLQCDNILYLGETAIGVQIFTVSFTVLRLMLNRSNKMRTPAIKLIITTLISLVFSIVVSLIVNDSFELTNLIGLAMILVYVIFAIMITQKRITVDLEWLERVESFIIIFVLAVGVLQMLSKAGFTLFDNLLTTFIYNDTENTNVIFHHKPNIVFYSTFMESSFCGAFLVAMFTSIVLRNKTTTKNIVIAIAVMMAIILTRSSTAFGGLAITICLLFFVKSKKKVFKWLIPAIIITALYVFTFNIDLLNEVIFDKIGSEGSFATRSNWNKAALEAFLESPVVGIGFKNIRASSIYVSLLGEIGVLGIIPYTTLILFCAVQFFRKKPFDHLKAQYFYVFSITVCQIIACPDLNFSPFWLGIYLLLLTMRGEKNMLQNNGETAA